MLDGMTNIKASEVLKEIKYYTEDLPPYSPDEVAEALEMAIKALEQQPSEDCISRQAVIDAINFEDEWLFDAKSHNADTKIAFSSLESRVKALPSVTPKYTDEEIDKIQAVEQAYVDKMVELAVEETERPKGKWIDFNWNDGDICRWGIKCSECHTEYKHGGEMWHNPKFCPNCGSYNGGGEDG